jgi:type IV pilus assembly protein PilV
MFSRAASGFTLAEVLVGLVLLAIGVMGAVAMQAKAQRSRLEAHLMSQALHLASSLGDRIHANDVQLDHYLDFQYDADRDGPPKAPEVLCFDGSDCDTAQLVAFDLFEASQQLHTAFPGGRIGICHDGKVLDAGTEALLWECDGNSKAPVTIKIGWLGRHADGKQLHKAPRVALPLPVRSAP